MILDLTRRSTRIGWAIACLVLILVFGFPFLSMIGISFTGLGVVENYEAVLEQPVLPGFFLNSLIISVISVCISYFATMLAAYGFARLRMVGKELWFYALVVTLTLPTIALTVPLFNVVGELNLFNNYLAVALPLCAILIPFNLLIARGALADLPNEVFEAAMVDGCGTFATFWRIALPMSRAVGGVIIIWSFLGAWNEYTLPLLFLSDHNRQPLTMLPQFFVSDISANEPQIVAASVIILLPIVIVYLLTQKLFEHGVSAGTTK
jgi:raffinose/stachyose/melibiose transport system permease protein